MARQAMGIDQKVVHGAEFHLVGVLIYAGENLRQECCKYFSLKRIREAMGNNEAFLEGDDRTGDFREFGEAINDLGG